MKDHLIEFYLQYINNFKAIPKLAAFYELPEKDCMELIRIGEELYLAEEPSYEEDQARYDEEQLSIQGEWVNDWK